MASQVFLRPDRIIWMFLLELQAIKLLHWKIDNGLHKQSDEWRKNIHKSGDLHNFFNDHTKRGRNVNR